MRKKATNFTHRTTGATAFDKREKRFKAGLQPCNRDDVWLAFGSRLEDLQNGQVLAGTGALVFEGELLSERALRTH